MFRKRIKLFSTSPRIKLFSSEPEVSREGDNRPLKTVVCRDCGEELVTAASPTACMCPKCGGQRFSIKLDPTSPEQAIEKVEDKDNEFESKLKRFSGTTMSIAEFQKNFSDVPDMSKSGYAQFSNTGVSISDDAYITEKIFSKITITVTKELDLDPEITEKRSEFPDVLDSLRGEIPEKGIILIRKAHNPIKESAFSEEESGTPEQWVEDSRIIPDLQVEYYNESMSVEQFKDILDERYPDAPDNILDLLVEKNAISIKDNQVTILK